MNRYNHTHTTYTSNNIDMNKMKGVQIKEFGAKLDNSNMNTYKNRVQSANNMNSKNNMVYSTINKQLKLELRRHVPMYNHSEMGKILYKETESKIVRPSTANTTVYKQISKHRPSSNTNTYSSNTNIRPQSKVLMMNQSIRNASIMSIDNNRDMNINNDLHSFFKCTSYGNKNNVEHDRNVKINNGHNNIVHHNENQTDKYYGYRRRSYHTVMDNMKRSTAGGFKGRPLSFVQRSEGEDGRSGEVVGFENYDRFVTLAHVVN